jgi:CheY-like chemotaxis protein
MPVMNGLDAAPLLRKLLPNTRIIMFTVQEGREIEQLARAAGANSVVSKRQAASELIRQAQVLLARYNKNSILPIFPTLTCDSSPFVVRSQAFMGAS